MDQRAGALMEIVVECTDLDAMVSFFVAELDGRVELITPADDPAEYVIDSHGVSVRLVRGDADRPVRLRLYAADDGAVGGRELVAPNGSVVEFVSSSEVLSIPESMATLSVVQADGDDEFGVGRAGMGYRDLLPDRWGGSFIASHILIADGGDVDDYVHFHRIRFQMIFVAAGWVDVVYEDQGEPFRMHAGDCVLQPPEIRHRVLRSSPGLEVIEIGSPAVHDTLVEHEICLPNSTVDPTRDFGGQRFVRHIAAEARTDATVPTVDGFVHRDTGIAGATDGLADARVLTMPAAAACSDALLTNDGEFAMVVGLSGSATLTVEADEGSQVVEFSPRDAVALPPGSRWSWTDRTADFELLQVALPAHGVRSVEVAHAG